MPEEEGGGCESVMSGNGAVTAVVVSPRALYQTVWYGIV